MAAIHFHFYRSRETTLYLQHITKQSFFIGRSFWTVEGIFAILFFPICSFLPYNLNTDIAMGFLSLSFFSVLVVVVVLGRTSAVSEEVVNQTQQQLLPLISTAAAAFGWREMGWKRQVSVNLSSSFIGSGNERDQNYCLFCKRERLFTRQDTRTPNEIRGYNPNLFGRSAFLHVSTRVLSKSGTF